MSTISPISTRRTITTHLISLHTQKTTTELEIQVLTWDRHKHVARSSILMGPQLPPTVGGGGGGGVVIVWQLDLQLPVQSVPITSKVVSSNPVNGEMYSIQHYVIKFVRDLRQVGGFLRVLRFPPPIKLTAMI
jgi:hypothetical protein